MLKFNYNKYAIWRKEHEKLTDETLEVLNQFDDYRAYDGINYDEMWKLGKIILKDWCDERT